MANNQYFDNLIEKGVATSRVVGVDDFLVRLEYANGFNMNSLVLFENGSSGTVFKVDTDYIYVLKFDGGLCVISERAICVQDNLSVLFSDLMFGKIIDPVGRIVDNGEIINNSAVALPLFGRPIQMSERTELNDFIETGVVAIDSLFPILKGQRMTLLGPTKCGKTSLALQIAANVLKNKMTVIYVTIGKKPSELNQIFHTLNATGYKSFIVMDASLDHGRLGLASIGPDSAVAIAENIWHQSEKDVMVIYDDLTTHAQILREIGLLSYDRPGREGYPSKVFSRHASVLEKSGKHITKKGSLTSIAVVNSFGEDITSYIPTNIVSITDGQWILDVERFNAGIRPAISSGLSVSRIGGRGLKQNEKEIASKSIEALKDGKAITELTRFGNEISPESKTIVAAVEQINKALTQPLLDYQSKSDQNEMLKVILDIIKK